MKKKSASNKFPFAGFQTISYMAERVVGTGSFGVVFQVYMFFFFLSHVLRCTY